MWTIIRIALRNIREHKAKSIIIGVIITVGVLVMILGGALLDRAESGVKTAFIENFTGDVYVYGKDPNSKIPMPQSILFPSAMMGDQLGETPLLPDYPALLSYLQSRPEVENCAGILDSIVLFNIEDKGEAGDRSEGSGDFAMMGGASVLGIEPESYRRIFDNTTIVQGAYLEPGQEGIMLSAKVLERMNKASGAELKVGDQIILQGFGNAGLKMRKVPLVALFEANVNSEASNYLAYADTDTVRLISRLTVGGAEQVTVPESAKKLLMAESEDDVFGEEESVSGGSGITALQEAVEEAANAPKIVLAADSGAWQFIIVKLKDPGKAQAVIRSLNKHFKAQGIAAAAGDWKGAAFPFSYMIDLVQMILSWVISVLAVVALFVIVITLVVSIIERKGEIGTMRALGGQKSFVWLMFATETLTITLFFGLVGILLSAGVMAVVNLIGIDSGGNSFLTVLFGGPQLKLFLSVGTVLQTLGSVVAVGLLAHVVPVLVALTVQPVRAMQAE